MDAIVHGRLDGDSMKILEKLRRKTGWNDSEIIRRGIRALSSLVPVSARRTIVGLGKFASGVPDLGSNREHLEGFGRS